MRRMQFGTAALLALLAGCSSAAEDGTNTDVTTGQDAATSDATSGATSSSATATTTASSSTKTNAGTTTSPRVDPTGQTPTSTITTDAPGTTQNTVDPDSSDAPDESETGDDSDPASTEARAQDTADTTSTGGEQSSEPSDEDVVDVGADDKFSFFVTSYYHLALLSGSEDGFGGDLRYNGAATGLEGADAICQEMARRVSFGHKTWRAYLSTSTVNAKDRIGSGPWYDFIGALVADSPEALIGGGDREPGGCCAEGTYDEMGMFHDGSTDQNNDGVADDDHDTMTATLEDGTYSGFSCEDWTSTTATDSSAAEEEEPTGGGGGGGGGRPGGPGGMGGLNGGIMMGHSWPAGSGQHWATSHGGHNCAAGTNFVQNGPGNSDSVGGGGGYGGFYCFAITE